MADITKFLGKSKKVIINNEEIEIYPLIFNDVDLLIKMADKDSDIRAKSLSEILKKSLRKSFPGITDEQIDQIDYRYIGQFMSAVFDASGLEMDKKKLEEMTSSLTQQI